MQDMMKMYGMTGMDPSMFGGQETLILNAKHPLVQYILKNGENDNTSLFCEQLYDLAMISHKPLSPDEMTKFVRTGPVWRPRRAAQRQQQSTQNVQHHSSGSCRISRIRPGAQRPSSRTRNRSAPCCCKTRTCGLCRASSSVVVLCQLISRSLALYVISVPSDRRFAYSFLQIPPHGGHPCCSAIALPPAGALGTLHPFRARPWRTNKEIKDRFIALLSTHTDSVSRF